MFFIIMYGIPSLELGLGLGLDSLYSTCYFLI